MEIHGPLCIDLSPQPIAAVERIGEDLGFARAMVKSALAASQIPALGRFTPRSCRASPKKSPMRPGAAASSKAC